MKYGVEIRSDESGYLKVTKSGHYQFTLVMVTDEENDPMIKIHGFRVDQELERVLPPVSFSRSGIVHIVEVTRNFEDQILEMIRKRIAGSEAA